MMTAILCAKNILAGHRKYDPWEVNEDAVYHESGSAPDGSSASGLRSVPQDCRERERAARSRDAPISLCSSCR